MRLDRKNVCACVWGGGGETAFKMYTYKTLFKIKRLAKVFNSDNDNFVVWFKRIIANNFNDK